MITLRSSRALTIGLMLSSVASPVAAAQCTRGWTGTIQYARSQSNSDNKTVDHVSAGRLHLDWIQDSATWAIAAVCRQSARCFIRL